MTLWQGFAPGPGVPVIPGPAGVPLHPLRNPVLPLAPAELAHFDSTVLGRILADCSSQSIHVCGIPAPAMQVAKSHSPANNNKNICGDIPDPCAQAGTRWLLDHVLNAQQAAQAAGLLQAKAVAHAANRPALLALVGLVNDALHHACVRVWQFIQLSCGRSCNLFGELGVALGAAVPTILFHAAHVAPEGRDYVDKAGQS